MSNYWAQKESEVHVSSKLPSSPALGYNMPDLKKVAVKISSDEEDFIPLYSSFKNEADLFVNSPEDILMLTGSSYLIDCGFSLELPPGYKIRVDSVISSVFLNLVESKRVKVNVLNLGKELILHHKKKIGKIWIEPVYFFEWITKG